MCLLVPDKRGLKSVRNWSLPPWASALQLSCWKAVVLQILLQLSANIATASLGFGDTTLGSILRPHFRRIALSLLVSSQQFCIDRVGSVRLQQTCCTSSCVNLLAGWHIRWNVYVYICDWILRVNKLILFLYWFAHASLTPCYLCAWLKAYAMLISGHDIDIIVSTTSVHDRVRDCCKCSASCLLKDTYKSLALGTFAYLQRLLYGWPVWYIQHTDACQNDTVHKVLRLLHAPSTLFA